MPLRRTAQDGLQFQPQLARNPGCCLRETFLLEFARSGWQHTDMLRIDTQTLPDVDVAYIALRLSFFETLERMTLAQQLGVEGEGAYGYLAEVPFLRNVAPQVQLDLLLDCWQKLRSRDDHAATLVDEAVVYAACETAARIVEVDEEFLGQFLENGPRTLPKAWQGGALADELRFLHLGLPNDGDFLLISQFQDVEPEEADRLKAAFGLNSAGCEGLLDVIGRWHVSLEFSKNAYGLLDNSEIDLTREILGL